MDREGTGQKTVRNGRDFHETHGAAKDRQRWREIVRSSEEVSHSCGISDETMMIGPIILCVGLTSSSSESSIMPSISSMTSSAVNMGSC